LFWGLRPGDETLNSLVWNRVIQNPFKGGASPSEDAEVAPGIYLGDMTIGPLSG